MRLAGLFDVVELLEGALKQLSEPDMEGRRTGERVIDEVRAMTTTVVSRLECLVAWYWQHKAMLPKLEEDPCASCGTAAAARS